MKGWNTDHCSYEAMTAWDPSPALLQDGLNLNLRVTENINHKHQEEGRRQHEVKN